MISFKNIKVIASDGREVKSECKCCDNNNYLDFVVKLKERCTVKEIVLFSGEHGQSPDTAFYGDGYQMLAQYGGTVGATKLIGSYSDKDHYKMSQAENMLTAYNYITFENNQKIILVGAVSCNRFRTELRVSKTNLVVAQAIENLKFEADDEIHLERMILLEGDNKNSLLEIFAEKISQNHPMKTYSEFPIGWCSWYCIGPDISEKKIFESLNDIKNKLPEIKYIQIDDGFQPFMGDWLEVSDKFDRSMKDICLDIKAAGFEPAVWLAPFIASPKSRLLKEHPDYFVKDENGKPLRCDKVTFSGWRDAPWYMLDGTNPNAQKYIFDVVKTIYNEWGVKYFKLDANTWGALPFGERYNKNATSVEAYRMMMKAFWEATGEDAFILGCNAPMWPSLGLVSAMRVTNDTSRSINTMISVSKECFYRNWMNSKVWLNDPDCLILENSKCSVVNPSGRINKNFRSRKVYKLAPIYIRASGGTILSGDNVKTYTNKDVELFRQLISLPKVAACFDKNFEIGTIKYDNTVEYCIFNTSKHLKKHTIKIPENSTVTDMYKNKELHSKNGVINCYLSGKSAKWIAVKSKTKD